MSQITSHVLDTAEGRPAKGIALTLYFESAAGSEKIASDVTNDDGRAVSLLPKEKILDEGIYRMHFDLESYLGDAEQSAFYPHADITFRVVAGGEHYHIPLLLSPFGYTTYRGS